MRIELLVFGLVAGLCVTGCGSDSGGDGDGDGTNVPPKPDPVLPKGKGQPKGSTTAVNYIDGPYGTQMYSTIDNYDFYGYANFVEKLAAYEQCVADGETQCDDGMDAIQLADFYNPTGTDVYPEGSKYGAGQPKPTALLIDVASVWCVPCNIEAGTVLPPKYIELKPQGVQFLLQLADGADQNVAATPKSLNDWVKRYDVNYPATVDPQYRLGALFEADAFPANFIINLRNMKICEVLAGAPDPETTTGAAFWAKLKRVAEGNEPSCN